VMLYNLLESITKHYLLVVVHNSKLIPTIISDDDEKFVPHDKLIGKMQAKHTRPTAVKAKTFTCKAQSTIKFYSTNASFLQDQNYKILNGNALKRFLVCVVVSKRPYPVLTFKGLKTQ